MVSDKPVGRLTSVDALRGLGALAVLWSHGFFVLVGDQVKPGDTWFWPLFPFMQGATGVTLFLVVSGFCIHYQAAKQDPNVNPRFLSFWARRLRRLYPPYLAALGVAVVAQFLLPICLYPSMHLSWSDLWLLFSHPGTPVIMQTLAVHLLLLQPFFPVSFLGASAAVFWTLALEEQLYCMYFAIPALRRRHGMERTVLVALAVTLAWRFLVVFHGDLGQPPLVPAAAWRHVFNGVQPQAPEGWLMMGPAFWFEWALGALAVEVALQRSKQRPLYTNLPLAALSMVLAMACEWSRLGWVFTDALWGIGYFIVVNWLVQAEQTNRLPRWVAPLAAIGLFSYSLYLTHFPIVHLINNALMIHLPWQVAMPIGTLLCLPIAWVFYRLFERPAIHWSHQLRRPSPLE